MVFRIARRLLGLALVFLLVSAVVSHVGPSLAARSMSGYVNEVDAAEHGNYGEANAISESIKNEWLTLQRDASGLWEQAASTVERWLPRSN